MTHSESKFHSTKEMLDALGAARDEARLKLHLFSMDARERWNPIEERLNALETKLQHGVVAAAEAGLDAAGKAVHDLTQVIRDFVRDAAAK